VGPFEFAERIRTLESSLKQAGIHGESVCAFVKAMPQDEQRAIYGAMRAKRQTALWSEALANPHSSWFRLHQRLARKWDRAGFDESCRAHIEQDWTLALPLVSGQLRKKEYSTALQLVDEAIRSLLCLRSENAGHQPESCSLVVGRSGSPENRTIRYSSCSASGRGQRPPREMLRLRLP